MLIICFVLKCTAEEDPSTSKGTGWTPKVAKRKARAAPAKDGDKKPRTLQKVEADCGVRDVQMYVYKHNQAVRDDVVEDLLGLRETDRAMVVPMDVSGISPGSYYTGLVNNRITACSPRSFTLQPSAKLKQKCGGDCSSIGILP